MKLYECADCHSTLNLVTRVTKAAVARQKLKTALPGKTLLNLTTARLAAQSGQPRPAK
ncbi:MULTISPECIES: hypothetical protein [Bradyrhizobium]|uniref:hypothetical protein n=1 Tax=Bradyrhizobium TaxID=374 RepID=UPI0004080256|nr:MULTISPECIES: hypothetical protein [Bradyrhizobium]